MSVTVLLDGGGGAGIQSSSEEWKKIRKLF